MMIPWILIIGLGFMIVERLFPDQKLPASEGWWKRVITLNILQAIVVALGSLTWDRYLDKYSLMNLSFAHHAIEAIPAYFIVTFVFYWWHRWRHEVNAFWLAFHQVHHSPTRIETITSFYKNPLEILVNSLIIAFVCHFLFGMSIETGQWLTLYTAVAEFFYHTNIKTAHWVGYIFQRPEMHRIHHQRGKHYSNFSDIPFWDMLFGTYVNPPTFQGPCGFKCPREMELKSMLLMRNVNDPIPPTESK